MKNNKKVLSMAMALLIASSAIPANNVFASSDAIVKTAATRVSAISESKDKKDLSQSQIDKIVKKIKNADSYKELRKIENDLTDEERDNKEIKNAIKDKEKELDGEDDKDSKYKDGDKLRPTDIELSKNDKSVSGQVSKHKNAKISVYLDGKRIGNDTTDKKGKFEISLDKKVKDVDDLVFYAGSGKNYGDKDKNKSDKEVSPKNIKLKNSDKTITGELKDYPKEDVKIYYDGKLLGTATTDKDGYFEYKSDKKIKDIDDLEFYVAKEKSKVDEKPVIITKAMPKTKLVEGTASAEVDVEVRLAVADIKLGEGKTDKDGKFSISLNRDLVAGERLSVVALSDGKEINKSEFVVPQDFTEKEETEKAKTNVKAYIKGYSDGSFKPNNPVSRAEAATMIGRIINASDDFSTGNDTKFSDANNEWYSKAVNYVVEKNLIKGYEDGTFKPNKNITRAEFATIIANYVGNDQLNKSDLTDIKGHWAESSIDNVYTIGAIKGYEDKTFKPDNEITRAEAVTILNKVFDVKANNKSLITFTDVSNSDWFYNDVMDASK